MSYGDGQAISVGLIGSGKFLTPSGMAIVTTNVKTNPLVVNPTPINSSLPNFEKEVDIQLMNDTQKIVYNAPQVMVQNGKLNPMVFNSLNTVSLNERTICVVDEAIDLSLRQAICQVWDVNDTKKYILNYLQVGGSCKVKSPTIPVIAYLDNKIVIKDTKPSYSIRKKKLQLTNARLEKRVFVQNIDDYREIFNVGFTYVENRVSATKFNSINISPVSITVEDYKPPTISGGNVGGVKAFRIVAQKYSYFEYCLSFIDGNVVAIDGLPQGMVFENSYLKGSPIVSGDYPISIKLDNKNVLTGLLTVTQVPRQL